MTIKVRQLARQRGLLLKAALLTVIWGLVLSGAFSLQRALLARQVPELRQQLTAQAAQLTGTLMQLAEPLTGLLNDARINTQEDAESDMGRRRALYEFSYLQQQANVFAVDLSSGQTWQPAGAVVFPVKVEEIAAQAPAVTAAALLVRPIPQALENKPGVLLMKMNATRTMLVGLLLPWPVLESSVSPALLNSLQHGVGLNNGGTATLELLFSPDQRTWQKVGAQGGMQTAKAPSEGGQAVGVYEMAVPLTDMPGWQLQAGISTLALGSQVLMMQLGLLLAGALATLVLLRPDQWMARLQQRRQATGAAGAGAGADSSGVGAGSSGDFYNGGGFGNTSKVAYRDIPGLNAGDAGRTNETKTAAVALSAEPGRVLAEQERQKQRAQVKTISMLQKITMALESDGVYGLYQPIFQASDGQPVMHEVLCRLREPNGSELQPGAFLPVARQENLMPRLDAEVLKVVLHTYFAGGRQPATKLCLNISSTSMAGLTYMTSLMDSAYNHSLPYLVFEVRSQEILSDPGAMRFLHELKEMGAQLSVDYFGGGRKMLEASKALGFDFVKISIADRWQDMNQRRELLGIVKTAASLKLSVVMEKVEVQPMEVFSRRIGVPFMQGYHFAKPAPALSTTVLQSWRDGFAKEAAESDAQLEPDAAQALPVVGAA